MSETAPQHPGTLLGRILKRKKISISDLARKTKASKQTISKIIRCETSISPEVAIKIAPIVGLTPREILEFQLDYDLFLASQRLASTHSASDDYQETQPKML